MGFQAVYRTLQDLFPQVDARLLKAAAIEHPDDPNASVEFILTEVLPYTTAKLCVSTCTARSLAGMSSDENERHCVQRLAVSGCASPRDHESNSSVGEIFNGSGKMNKPVHVDMCDHLSQNTGTNILESSSLLVEDAVAAQDMSLKNNSVSHTYEEISYDDFISNIPSENNDLTATYGKFDLPDASFSSMVSSAVLENDPLANILNEPILVNRQKEHLRSDNGLSGGSNYVDLNSFSVEDHRLESNRCSIQSEDENNLIAFDDQISEDHQVSNVAFSQDINESSSLDSVLAGSGQLCRTGLLQDIVEDSKTHKKTLFCAMESVLKLMKEVEIEEEIVQQAKEEAAKGGLEIHAKVDELKKMLKRAREANDMHSGEVYGERAVLATEVRELQSRLLVLSDEKDNSLAILDMMREDLETRLESAAAERIAAEKEKREKEEYAQRCLVEQELIMEKVVQESKILQQEAEENAKLRELLVDRGHVVDSLQGEICVICDDVKLMKEKYDAKVPLSECVTSKQTSCCILASSSSSCSSIKSAEKRPILSVAQVSESDKDESVEEGWELF